MSMEKRIQYGKVAARLGCERLPEIGRMTHFDSPWDGLYVMDRLVRWVTLGGPFKVMLITSYIKGSATMYQKEVDS